MITSTTISSEYLALAKERVTSQCGPHQQPEDFGYDFRTWVSPYTKGAHKIGGYALVLQDWASADGLSKDDPDPQIQHYGRTPTLLTNVRLEQLLKNVLGVDLVDTYVTNAFPFVKSGGMSAGIRRSEVRNATRQFAVRELELVRPTETLALGAVAYLALRQCGVSCIHLPHPAARIGGLSKHEAAWRKALSSAGITHLAPV